MCGKELRPFPCQATQKVESSNKHSQTAELKISVAKPLLAVLCVVAGIF